LGVRDDDRHRIRADRGPEMKRFLLELEGAI
jgi:hypothetical protein